MLSTGRGTGWVRIGARSPDRQSFLEKVVSYLNKTKNNEKPADGWLSKKNEIELDFCLKVFDIVAPQFQLLAK